MPSGCMLIILDTSCAKTSLHLKFWTMQSTTLKTYSKELLSLSQAMPTEPHTVPDSLTTPPVNLSTDILHVTYETLCSRSYLEPEETSEELFRMALKGEARVRFHGQLNECVRLILFLE